MPKDSFGVRAKPVLVGICGGSGSGKTWLADHLSAALPCGVVRFSQDSFYLDRSHLSPGRRALLNFDHPRSIDWEAFGDALAAVRASKTARIPEYDFVTHCRRPESCAVRSAALVIVDGLWLFLRAHIRRLFTLRVYMDCPQNLRLVRRLSRDQASRGRGASAIRRQFRETVEPMHRRYVIPQKEMADLVLRGDGGTASVDRVMCRLRDMSAILQ